MFLFALLLCAALIALWLFSFLHSSSSAYYCCSAVSLASVPGSLDVPLSVFVRRVLCGNFGFPVSSGNNVKHEETQAPSGVSNVYTPFPSPPPSPPPLPLPLPVSQLALLKYLTSSPGKLYVNTLTGFRIRTNSKLEKLSEGN